MVGYVDDRKEAAAWLSGTAAKENGLGLKGAKA
jgi:hypothetical protein